MHTYDEYMKTGPGPIPGLVFTWHICPLVCHMFCAFICLGFVRLCRSTPHLKGKHYCLLPIYQFDICEQFLSTSIVRKHLNDSTSISPVCKYFRKVISFKYVLMSDLVHNNFPFFSCWPKHRFRCARSTTTHA